MEIETTAVKNADERKKVAAMTNEQLASIVMKPMSRQQRRQWYRDNRKKLNLPPWAELQNIKATEHGIES